MIEEISSGLGAGEDIVDAGAVGVGGGEGVGGGVFGGEVVAVVGIFGDSAVFAGDDSAAEDVVGKGDVLPAWEIDADELVFGIKRIGGDI